MVCDILAFSEALERLLLQRFFGETNSEIPTELLDLELDEYTPLVIDSSHVISAKYETFKEAIRKGTYGKTAQYWHMYMDLMRFQHQIHIAVQENDFNQRLHAWEYFIPYYFATNKSNYARYGSFYLQTMKSIDILYPGLKRILEANCLSVQAQDRYPVHTAIDQRGEQTFNRDAKTIGGIKAFASDSSSVMKWTLNRAEQATNTNALYKMCSINESSEMYKPSRPSQILQSENRVADIARILTEEYLNPFSVGLDKSVLYNLSSGVPLPGKIADEILSFPDKGKTLAEEFLNKRLLSDEIPLSDPIRRNIDKKTLSTKKTVQIDTSCK